MDWRSLSSRLDAELDRALSAERAAHSRRVAELCAELCGKHGLDPEEGRAAGLAHDLCKELPKKEQRELAARYTEGGRSLEDASALMSDKVAHGPAAAVLLEREYGRLEPRFLEAIARHTVGKPGMGALATILYCADKLEPGRERMKDGYREACLALPLDAMLRSVVEGSIAWMRAQGKTVAPETLILYSTLAGGAGSQ